MWVITANLRMCPPSTCIARPVTNRACSLHKNATTAPKSAGSPKVPAGMLLATSSIVVAVQLRHPIGRVQAGLHRVDRHAVGGHFASNRLQEPGHAGTRRVRQDQLAIGWRTDSEVIATKRPQPFACMAGIDGLRHADDAEQAEVESRRVRVQIGRGERAGRAGRRRWRPRCPARPALRWPRRRTRCRRPRRRRRAPARCSRCRCAPLLSSMRARSRPQMATRTPSAASAEADANPNPALAAATAARRPVRPKSICPTVHVYAR